MRMTTTTTLVLEALVRADDFMSMSQLVNATGRSTNRVTAALHHLKVHKAIQAMEAGGQLYWYATQADDDRHRVVEEKREELKPRRPRKRKPTP